MDAAKKGADALGAGELDKAIELYSSAISVHPESADYYIQRSTAYRRSKKAGSALTDAEAAVVLAVKRAKRELIAKAQLERGIVYYQIERFADALQCFQWSAEYNEDKRLPIWKSKAEEKLSSLGEDSKSAESSIPKVPDVDIEAVKEAAKPKPTIAVAPAVPVTTPASQIRHDWYQTPEKVTITLMAKNVPKEKTQVDIGPRSLHISFPLTTGSDYSFSLEPLCGKVDVADSGYRILSTKIEINLKKATPGKWATLETASDQIEESATETKLNEASASQPPPPVPSSVGPQYPTSSRTGPKDWSKFDARDDDPDDDEDKNDPNGFFKMLYKNADPDTRRAMMKSYQESNGTALSTNWNEVATKKYETLPPDGMEAKNY